MSFVESVRSVYGNYGTFGGRASRSEYWWFQLFLFLAFLGAFIVAVAFAAAFRSSGGAGILFLAVGVFYLLSIVPSLAVLCRRLHDTDRSGWWFWITLIPWVGGLILIILMVLPSSPGYNKYGPSPGQPAADAFAEYHGATRSDALQQFSMDAQRAAASGYQPVHQEWQPRLNGEVLVVAYQRTFGDWPPSSYQTPPWQGPGGGLS